MSSRSVNKVILVGNLGRDAETRFTPSGVAKTRFSVGTNRRWKDQQTNEWKDEANWTDVTAWRMENLTNYLTKGKEVYVEGRLRNYSYDAKDGTKKYASEVVADTVMLLGGKESGAGSRFPEPTEEDAEKWAPPPRSTSSTTSQAAMKSDGKPDEWQGQSVTDDDVPF
jgi:single-strand DNA-binding protein